MIVTMSHQRRYLQPAVVLAWRDHKEHILSEAKVLKTTNLSSEVMVGKIVPAIVQSLGLIH